MDYRVNFRRRVQLIIIFLLLSVRSHSQTAEIDSIINIIEFKQDSVLAIFNWIANEIEYDTQSLLLVNENNLGLYSSPTKSIIREVITRKKGVCQHYAELFNALLTRLGYESYVIVGYVIQQEMINSKDAHAWNAVKINDDWFLYDPTWAAGYVNNFIFKKRYNENWYKVSPENFIQTHIPFDPIWQFLNPPLSNYQIIDGDFTTKDSINFNFQDSILAGVRYTSQEQSMASLQRIKQMGLTNNLIQKYAENLKNDYYFSIIQRSQDSVHRAINYYNNYIIAKNNQFKKPVWTDEMIGSMPENIKVKIDASNDLLNSVTTSDSKLVQYKSETKKQILNLSESVGTETIFINKYLSTWKPLRIVHTPRFKQIMGADKIIIFKDRGKRDKPKY